MRKFILVAALVLASASAQAGASRGLALASDEPVTTEQPKAAETSKATEAPKYVERPPAVEPTTDQPKVDQPKFTPETVVFDTIYNPMKTKLLNQAETAGAQTIGGVEMFIRQAAAQFQAWTDLPAPSDVMRDIIAAVPAYRVERAGERARWWAA